MFAQPVFISKQHDGAKSESEEDDMLRDINAPSSTEQKLEAAIKRAKEVEVSAATASIGRDEEGPSENTGSKLDKALSDAMDRSKAAMAGAIGVVGRVRPCPPVNCLSGVVSASKSPMHH